MPMPESGSSSSSSNTSRTPLTGKSNRWAMPVCIVILVIGAIYVIGALGGQLETVPAVPWVLLTAALLLAFGFEFVNGFHDTANAVATVIYTRSMSPQLAVLWSGIFNFLGALMASGAVAYGIIALLPVELITQSGTSAGLAMVFSLLISAIGWNLGTWYFSLPNSSSHTLIGSILGVGLANRFLESGNTVASGVDWAQAEKIGLTLLISPLIGFIGAACLLVLMKLVIRSKTLSEEAGDHRRPPLAIRSLLVLTCTGVSFAHGSNDGQKGMGLIMLILIGLVPTAFALNQGPDPHQLDNFKKASVNVEHMLSQYPQSAELIDNPQKLVSDAVKTRTWQAQATPALSAYVRHTRELLAPYHTFADIPADQVTELRNDIYLTGHALTLMESGNVIQLSEHDHQVARDYHRAVNAATEFIPVWVKVAVALALGLGTMIGWKRVVTTVGEKIGRSGLNYGQGIAAQGITMATIALADKLGMPASTTHVLSSGIAGTMAAQGSGLQWSTIRNMMLAWIMTLPATILFSFVLFIILRHLV